MALRRSAHKAAILGGFLMLWLGMGAAGEGSLPPQAIVHAAQPDLPQVARRLPMGGALRVSGIAIEGLLTDTLDLSRFPVFSEDAQVVIDDAHSLPAPSTAYFRGPISGDPESIAVLAIPESGSPRGLLLSAAGIWMIEEQPVSAAKGLNARKLGQADLAALKGFRCGTDGFGLVPEVLGGDPAASATTTPVTGAATVAYTARVAVDTDAEYYNHFNDTTEATDYVGDLFAYASSIYEREIRTSLTLSYLRLWTVGAASDPWAATSGTSAALDEFVSYWRANMGGVDRTIAHMLSGKGLGGGIAYVGVLCNNSYGYGLSSSLGYNFTRGTTQTLWDTLVVTHEIGHNFNSPHTHSYCNIDGNSQPVDACVPQAYGPACNNAYGQLPAGCPGSGQGCGTIMSYCHLISGGYANIAMTFGLGHLYGVLPDRVPQRMSAHVQSQAASNPGCLAPVVDGPLLTVSKSGTGSGTVTSTDGGINCGSDCTQNYTTNTSVSLNASPAVGSSFSSWSGACGGTNSSTSVTMDADKTCTAEFTLNPVTPMHVGDLDNTSTRSGTRWNARVTVTVHKANDAGVDTGVVSGATVSGTWSNGTTGSASCTTNSSGQCTPSKSNLKTTVGSVTFTVSNVTASGYSYISGKNHDPENDSNGTVIIVTRPN